MTKSEMQMVESVQDGWHVGCAILYPMDGSEKRMFVFDMVPENIASFIYRNREEARKIEITDMLGNALFRVDTNGDSTCQCRELCQKIADSLQAILDGSEPAEFSIVSRSLYDRYCDLEENALLEMMLKALLKKDVEE